MRNGRTFPYRPRRVDTSGDGEGQARGVLDAPVKAGRPHGSEAHRARGRDARRSTQCEGAAPMPPRKTARVAPRAPVPKPTQVGG